MLTPACHRCAGGDRIDLATVNKKKIPANATNLSSELRLRHLTVDEAMPLLDQFLYDAYMAGLIQVKIIHGKGTGTLRRLVRQKLAHHPLVKSHRPGEYGEGEAGVTIAEFADK